MVLRVPVVREAVEALCMARVCATFRAMSESGIRVVEALEACAAVAGNDAYSRGIGRVVAAVRENATVGEGFERSGVFAPGGGARDQERRGGAPPGLRQARRLF
jgi:type II secretory pathway component PulF